MKTWFLLSEGQVSGPFEVAEIEGKLPSATEPLIWGRGQSEWMKPDKWRRSIQGGGTAAPAATGEPDRWMVRVEGKEKPPMDYENMLQVLRGVNDYSTVDIRPEGSLSWKEIYAVQRVVDELGITRRSHPRVPIMGNFEGEAGGLIFQSKVISISEGGAGLNEAKGRKIGERFKGTITSPNLYVPIHSLCEVVYVGTDGYAGLKFIGLPAEEKSAIIEYVNKFST